jgi:N-acyl-D-aspartate/D-glutamate deacylase
MRSHALAVTAGCLCLAAGAAPSAHAQRSASRASPAAARRAAARAADTLDVLITGGTIVDGSGGPERVGDVGIRGDRIVVVGPAVGADARALPARRRIDARGRIVAPGFIDPHTHSGGDLSSPERRGNLPFLMQGVTTVVVGNDGGGPVDVARTLARWERDGIGTNAALLTGFGTIRQRVLGMSGAPASPAQIDAMRALVDSAMREGALGLSTGLFYPPQSFAATEEVIALAKVAARHGGIYDSHLRDESSYTIGLLGSIEETLRIGREAALPVHVAHIKALGVDVWGQSDTVIALIESARRRGQRVTADQYPYTASGTGVGASLLPSWATVGGRDSLFARIANPAQHARLVADMRENLRRRGGAATLLVRSSRDTALVGRTLAEIAAARRLDPIDAALEIIRAGDAGVASFNMTERDIERFMRQDFVMTGSDGSEGMPRKYGTFPKKLHDYVFAKHLLTLPFAIRQSTALTAETFHLQERGRLEAGYYADVVVFDSTIVDHATYTESERFASGVEYVVVNGKLAVDGGRATGVLAGRGVRRGREGAARAGTQ